MTQAEKQAKELVERFISFSMDNHIPKYALHNAKQCALICVDEIIKAHETLWSDVASGEAKSCLYTKKRQSFWQKVKQEIEKL